MKYENLQLLTNEAQPHMDQFGYKSLRRLADHSTPNECLY
jgi:hypothetical protein